MLCIRSNVSFPTERHAGDQIDEIYLACLTHLISLLFMAPWLQEVSTRFLEALSQGTPRCMLLLNRPSCIQILCENGYPYICVSVIPCPDRAETQPASDKIESVLSSFVENAIALHSSLFSLPDNHYGDLSTIRRFGASTLCKRANLLL